MSPRFSQLGAGSLPRSPLAEPLKRTSLLPYLSSFPALSAPAMSIAVDVKYGARDLTCASQIQNGVNDVAYLGDASAPDHARLNQRNGEETIERRYRQYLRIEPQMRLRRNASFVLRGYPIGDEIGGGHTRSHQGGSYDSRRRTENERQTHSILGHVDQRRPSSSQDTDPQC